MNKGLKKLTKKERAVYLSIASVFYILLSLLFTYFKPINTLDYMVSDFFYQSLVEKKERNLNIKIIAIDEKTTSKLGSFKDWDRSEAARLVNYLNNNGNEPDVIAFGLDFHDEKDIKGDTELINACREHKNVCIRATVETKTKKTAMAKKVRLVSMTSGTDNPDEEILYAGTAAYNPPQGTMGGEKITGVSTPFKALLPHIATGVINTTRSDEDGYVRNLIASVNYNDTHYESFPIIVLRMYLYQNGKDYDIPEANYENELGINYSKNGGNFKT